MEAAVAVFFFAKRCLGFSLRLSRGPQIIKKV